MAADTARLFLGLVPPPSLHAALDVFAREAGDAGEAGAPPRWEPRARRHVTLRFLGDVPLAALADLRASTAAACAAFAARGVPLALGAPTFEIRSGRPKALAWIRFADPSGAFADLVHALRADLDAVPALSGRLHEETRAPLAHLTLARDARLSRPDVHAALARAWAATAEAVPDPCSFAFAALWRSHLGPAGPTYDSLATFPLEVCTSSPIDDALPSTLKSGPREVDGHPEGGAGLPVDPAARPAPSPRER